MYQFLPQLSCDGFMNMAISSIKSGKNKASQSSLQLDKTYIKVKGKWHYLYRTIDKDDHRLDFQLRKTRNHQAAYAFMKRLMKHFEQPSVLTKN